MMSVRYRIVLTNQVQGDFALDRRDHIVVAGLADEDRVQMFAFQLLQLKDVANDSIR